MKKSLIFTLALIALLSACVPIPHEPPTLEPVETEVGFSALARVLANNDGGSKVEEYIRLAEEYEKCIHEGMGPKENMGLSSSEYTSFSLYAAGQWSRAAMIQAVEESEEYEDVRALLRDTNRPNYAILELAVKFCKGD